MIEQTSQGLRPIGGRQSLPGQVVGIEAKEVIHDRGGLRDFRGQAHLLRLANARAARTPHPVPHRLDATIEGTDVLDAERRREPEFLHDRR
jgi:hypothetical protein